MSIRTLPLTIVLIVHAIALSLFIGNVGVEYPSGNRATLLVYLLILTSAMIAGFSAGVRLDPAPARPLGSKLAKWGLVLNALLLLPTIAAYTGGSFGQFFQFLTDPAGAYQLMSERVAQGRDERAWLILLQSLASPFVVTTIPCLGFIYFRYRRGGRLFLSAVAIVLILSVFRGTDKEVFDVAILTFVAWVMAKCNGAASNGVAKVRLVSARALVVGGAAVVAVGAVFSFRKAERMADATAACFRNTSVCQSIDTQNLAATGIDYLSRYMSQGFYGLSVAMDADPAVAGNGVGHSRPLTYLAEQVGLPSNGGGVTEQLTWLGWTSEGAWSTGYVWIANDVTLYGVPFVILAMGLLFGMGWRQVLEAPTLAGLVMTAYLFYTFVYMIGNLQLAQSGSAYLGVVFWALVYLKQRRRSGSVAVEAF